MPILVEEETGKNLSTLSDKCYDSNSVSNPYGRYGSRYCADSANDPYATSPPNIADDNR